MTDMADGNEPESERLQSLMDRMQALTDPLAMDTNQGLSPKGYLEEEFDIDLEFEAYEKIEVPDFSDGRKGRFVHDFALVSFFCHTSSIVLTYVFFSIRTKQPSLTLTEADALSWI